MCKAHAAAYSEIKCMIQKQVITGHKVLPLLMLWYRYINELQEQSQPNENFSLMIRRKCQKTMLKLHLLYNFLKLNARALYHFGLFSVQIYQLKQL